MYTGIFVKDGTAYVSERERDGAERRDYTFAAESADTVIEKVYGDKIVVLTTVDDWSPDTTDASRRITSVGKLQGQLTSVVDGQIEASLARYLSWVLQSVETGTAGAPTLAEVGETTLQELVSLVWARQSLLLRCETERRLLRTVLEDEGVSVNDDMLGIAERRRVTAHDFDTAIATVVDIRFSILDEMTELLERAETELRTYVEESAPLAHFVEVLGTDTVTTAMALAAIVTDDVPEPYGVEMDTDSLTRAADLRPRERIRQHDDTADGPVPSEDRLALIGIHE